MTRGNQFTSRGIPYLEIVERLNDYAEEVAFDCLSSGAKKSGPRIFGDCNGKCSVIVSGNNRGLVGFWQGQRPGHQGGNLIHLIEIANGVDHGAAVRLAKQKYLGIPDDRPISEEERARYAIARAAEDAKSKARRDKQEKLAAAQTRRRSGDVNDIWHQCCAVEGTAAGAYLERRIGLPAGMKWPPSLRFHPSMFCEIAGAAGLQERWPCLIAGVQSAERKLIAIWRIFLKPDGTNLIIDGEKVKRGLGPAAGGAVRLSPVGDTWNVGEGLESTLGAMALGGWKGAWASTLSTSGMRGVGIPQGVKALRIWTDGDKSRFRKGADGLLPPPGQGAGAELQKRGIEAGLTCSVHEPPPGSDWQDVWQHTRDRQGDSGE